MEREEALAAAEERRDREIDHHGALLRTRAAGYSAGGLERLKRRIDGLTRDIADFEQGFKRDWLPPTYARRLLWLIDPNANRNVGEPDLDPQIIAWLEAACADIDW
jgi:hypothetical protein